MTTPNLDSINAAIEAAKQAAGAIVPQAAPNVGGAVANYSAPAPVAAGKPVSMREMLAESTLSVDAYLKVDKLGFLIGDDTLNFVREITVEFRFGDAKPFYGLRYGDPAKYDRSYDRLTNARNRLPWAQCVAEAQRLDSRCRGDYRSVDVPFKTIEDITSLDGKTVLVEAGKTLGWTASVTNWKDFVSFAEPFYKLMDAGHFSEDIVLRGKIIFAQRKNDKNTWGALTFGDFAAVGIQEAAAETEQAA